MSIAGEQTCMRPLPAEDVDDVVTQTLPLWEEARGESFFFTGGTGFFGKWLLETFVRANQRLKLGCEVCVLTRDPARFRKLPPNIVGSSAVRLQVGDVRNFSFPPGKYKYVVHAATDANFAKGASAARRAFDVIERGTERVLDFAIGHGTKKLLLTSSGAVYGRATALAQIAEECPVAPDPMEVASSYGEAKRVAEHLCVLAAAEAGIETKVARCFAFVGPGIPLDGPFAAGNFIRDALQANPIRVTGDGSACRSYLYAADLAIWLWTILFSGTSSRAYNVGSEDAVSVMQLAELVARLSASVVESAGPAPVQPARASSIYVPSTARARQELRLQQITSLPEAVRKTLAWYRLSHEGI